MTEQEIEHVRKVFQMRPTFWRCPQQQVPMRIVGYVADHKENPDDPNEPAERAFRLGGGGVISAENAEFSEIVHMQRATLTEQMPVKERALQHTIQFLAVTGAIVLPPPEVRVTPAGDLTISWKKEDRWALTLIHGGGRYGYTLNRAGQHVPSLGYIGPDRVPDDLLAFFAT